MRAVVISLVLGILATVALLAGAPFAVQSSALDEEVVPDQYIVVLHPGAELSTAGGHELLQASGIEVTHVYTSALNGFAARIPASRLAAVASDPAVASIIPDRKLHAFDDIRSTGIRRSEADRNAITQITSHTNPVDVDVAVLDSGIDSDHPDLNVVGGYTCAPGETSWEDAHGHGTHVAGIIGALDNGSGVVGVAPGARLWSIRVLNAQGEGEVSDLICAVDWVTANAGTIEVANLSLRAEDAIGSCSDGGLHQAICTSVAAGVTYIAAAGNSATDASGFVPAAYDEVITVSALADLDGKPGGEGGFNFFFGADDTLATFSNFGAQVDIAAPGVGILSTWVGGIYSTQSGTSMAAPHVTGAAAVYLHQNPGASPAEVKAHLLSIAWEQGSEKGFTGDVDAFPEPLLNAGEVGGLPPLDPPPPPEAECSLSPDHGPTRIQATITCQGFPAGGWVWIYWDSIDAGIKGLMITSTSGTGSAILYVPDSPFGEHQVILRESSSGTTATLPYTVEPTLRTSAASGAVKSGLSGSMTGFGAEEVVTITWRDSEGPATTLTSATTTAVGSASAFIQVPETVSGEYVIEAVGQTSGAVATKTFVVEPSIRISPWSAIVGQSISVTVQGFAPQAPIEIALDGSPIASATTSASGSVAAAFTLQDTVVGDHTVTASTTTRQAVSDTLSVRSAISTPIRNGHVGDEIVITMTGFGGDEMLDLLWYDTSSTTQQVGTATTSESGAASATITIPQAEFGGHKLEARGRSSGSSAYIYIYAQASIELDPDSGPSGAEVSVTLDGFPANADINLEWFDTTASKTVIANASTSAHGSASAIFTVPDGATLGEHRVRAIAASSHQYADTAFIVEPEGGLPGNGGPTCLVDPSNATPGMSVTVSCWAFEPGQAIRLYLDTETSPALSSFYTPSGSATRPITLRDATGGDHILLAIGMVSGERAEVPLTIESKLSVSSSPAEAGSYVSLRLQGFGNGETVDVTWQAPSGPAVTVATVATASNGSNWSSLKIPEVPEGLYTITATGRASGLQASVSIEVLPGIQLSPSAGRVGAVTTVTLSGFAPGSPISVTWDGVEVAAVTASGAGSASAQITIPAAPGGYHEVAASTSAGVVDSANYRILPGMTMSPARGSAGTVVTVTLTGFGQSEMVSLEWYETSASHFTIATVTTQTDGGATVTFEVPYSPKGNHRVSGIGAFSNSSGYAYFYVDSSIALSLSEGPAGTTFTADITGFRAGETVEIHWYSTSYSWTAIATGTAEADGTVSITLDAPVNATTGTHKVEAYGTQSHYRVDTTFTVT